MGFCLPTTYLFGMSVFAGQSTVAEIISAWSVLIVFLYRTQGRKLTNTFGCVNSSKFPNDKDQLFICMKAYTLINMYYYLLLAFNSRIYCYRAGVASGNFRWGLTKAVARPVLQG